MSRASLTTIVRRSLAGECALPPKSVVIVAVSGGPDSMALLDVMARIALEFDLTPMAHGVDHGLRPAAKRELDIAEAFARKLGVPFSRTLVNLTSGGNIQERARKLRWEALASVARRHEGAIATAHHADDRAETVLRRLVRGAGARGLGVLPARAHAVVDDRDPSAPPIALIRPLLRARREDIESYVGRHAVPCSHDPSNVDPRYLRTAMRRDVLPLLAKLDPNIVRHLEALADELASAVPAPSPSARPGDWTSGLPRATQEAIAKLLRTPSEKARVWLPGGLVVSAEPRAGTGGGHGKTRADAKSARARPRTHVVRPKLRG